MNARTMPRTPLDRLVEDRVSHTTAGTISVAVEKIAEEIAREALADEDFRRILREMVKRRSAELLVTDLTHLPAHERVAVRA